MIDESTILNAGFKSYVSSIRQENEKRNFSKKVRGENGDNLYFIHIDKFEYQFPEPQGFVIYWKVTASLFVEGHDFQIQHYVHKETTVEDIESFYKSCYEKLGCIPDIHNN